MEDLDTITGSEVIDRNGDRVGKVTDVLVDQRTLRPKWAVVTYGVLHGQHRPVPVRRIYASADQRRLVVEMDRDAVRHAPRVHAQDVLTGELERELESYYGTPA